MNRLLKMIMLWLLMVALPVQGIAAATMISCGPDHKAAVSAPAAADHHHGAANVLAHHHEKADSPASVQHQQLATGDHAGAVHKTSACSACSACCVGAVILPTILNWDPAPVEFELSLPLPAFSLLSHIPAGLERPPRSYSA